MRTGARQHRLSLFSSSGDDSFNLPYTTPSDRGRVLSISLTNSPGGAIVPDMEEVYDARAARGFARDRHDMGLAGSIAGMLLADYGARVVKLERAGAGSGDNWVLRGWWSGASGASPWIPGTRRARPRSRPCWLGPTSFWIRVRVSSGWLAPVAVGERHPRLVHCRISAYGVDGPFCDRPGWDALVAARFGLMVEQPGHRDVRCSSATRPSTMSTAFLAAIGVLAALRARHQTGRGQFVDTSLLDGALGGHFDELVVQRARPFLPGPHGR